MNGTVAYSLVSRRALVCGSTQGIGRACAMQFARLGATVTLVARDTAALERVCEELPRGDGQKHDWVCADFDQPDVLLAAVTKHLAATGDVHILLNNSGGPPQGPIIEARPQDFLKAFSRHVICNQMLFQTVLPGMKAAGYGRVINIISTSVKEPIPGLGISNTTRWAVAAWAKTTAGEVAKFGITVNNLLPGYTDTARLTELMNAKAKAGNLNVEAVKTDLIAKIPMGRLASADEIAAAAGFLASPAASYVTGINLPVDGGRTASL